MSTLIVSSYMPTRGSGRAARTYGIVRALAVGGPVELLHTRFGARRRTRPTSGSTAYGCTL